MCAENGLRPGEQEATRAEKGQIDPQRQGSEAGQAASGLIRVVGVVCSKDNEQDKLKGPTSPEQSYQTLNDSVMQQPLQHL